MKIKIYSKNKKGIPFKREGDACEDIYVDFSEGTKIVLEPGETKKFPTGLYSIIEKGYKVKLLERSSTGMKGLSLRAGVIDSNYRGEWLVMLTNVSNIPVIFLDDEVYKYPEEDWKEPILYEGKSVNLYPLSKAICQMDVIKEEPRKIEEVSYEEIVLDKTERGDGKEGSSGK